MVILTRVGIFMSVSYINPRRRRDLAASALVECSGIAFVAEFEHLVTPNQETTLFLQHTAWQWRLPKEFWIEMDVEMPHINCPCCRCLQRFEPCGELESCSIDNAAPLRTYGSSKRWTSEHRSQLASTLRTEGGFCHSTAYYMQHYPSGAIWFLSILACLQLFEMTVDTCLSQSA